MFLRAAAPAEFMTRSLANPQVKTVLAGRSGGRVREGNVDAPGRAGAGTQGRCDAC
jgi:hypothetical protein